DRTHSCAGRGSAHRFRIDVVAKSEENRGAKHPVRGPLLELHFRDELGPHPGGWAVELRFLRKRADVGAQLLAARLHLGERAIVEPRADVSAVAQLALVPVAEEQGAERPPRALALGEPADRELGALRRLDLEPGWRALAGFVFAVLALGDDTLEAARQRRLVELFAVFLGVHQLHVGGGLQALL